MFKKHMKISAIVIIFLLLISSKTFAQNTIVDVNNLNLGTVGINYNKDADKMKVLITKGEKTENYDLKSNMQYPLQFGNGTYSISILEHVRGNQYRQLANKVVELQLEDQNTLFLQSIETINWNKEMSAIKKARELTKNATTDKEKVEIIHNYITNNIVYDNDKANTVKVIYTVDIDEVLEAKAGICYDYAVTTAAMLRSLNVPTKLVTGYNKDIEAYHAWNEVYIEGEWLTIDTTYDASYAQANVSINMIKNPMEYKIEKIY